MKCIRLLYWVTFNKTRVFLLGIVLCVVLGVGILGYLKKSKATSTSRNLQEIKVLILYFSGKPTSQWKSAVPLISEETDGITSPTPKTVNTAVVAKMIANYLEKQMLQVTLKEIGEIKRAQDVLFADVILIGSATHFSNMDWQTKRFFDETLYPLYVHRKTKLSDKYIGCFTTVSGGGAEDCIKSMHHALRDYRSKELPSLIIFNNIPQNELEKKVAQFTKKLIAKLEEL